MKVSSANVVSLNAKMRDDRHQISQKSRIVAALDVGSTKICCLIGEVVPAGRKRPDPEDGVTVKTLGVGHQVARGLRNGVVTDIDAAERSIRLAVDAAERMANITIEDVFVNISGGRPKCSTFQAVTNIGGHMVESRHVDDVVHAALKQFDTGGRVILHATPTQFDLDEARGVKDPEGMFTKSMRVHLNIVTVEPAAMQNLQLVIERCHLEVAGFVMAPYAASRAVLAEDERDLGVTLIDIGGSTSSVAVFADGNLVFANMVPLGGHHITADLARGLSTSMAGAERLKTLYGSAIPSICDERETVAVPLLGEGEADAINKVPRSMLTGIIRPRVEEIFEVIRDKLEDCADVRRAGRRAVLTGGSSQLNGLRDVAAQMLDRHVRLGIPYTIAGLPDIARTGSFAVATGLMKYAIEPDRRTSYTPDGSFGPARKSGYFARMGQWIRESF